MGPTKLSPSPEPKWALVDRMGITASMACAVHCVFTGIFFLVLPGLFEWAHGSALFSVLSSGVIHWAFALMVYPLAIFSLTRGYKIHRKTNMLALGGFGLILITLGLVAPSIFHETLFTISGGVALALAHFLNLRHSGCKVSATKS